MKYQAVLHTLRMKVADFKKLHNAEKEHFYRCAKCRQYVDKRELRDVIFHESNHNPQTLALPRIIGKPILKTSFPALIFTGSQLLP